MDRRLLVPLLLAGLTSTALADEIAPDVVERVVDKAYVYIQSCAKTLPRGSTRAITLRLTVEPSGLVSSAVPLGPASREGECLAKVARTLRFPTQPATVDLDYPFLLMPHSRR